MKFHVVVADSPLCGNRSATAAVNCADCGPCNRRVDEVLLCLLDVAEGRDGAVARAKKLVEKLNLCREQGTNEL